MGPWWLLPVLGMILAAQNERASLRGKVQGWPWAIHAPWTTYNKSEDWCVMVVHHQADDGHCVWDAHCFHAKNDALAAVNHWANNHVPEKLGQAPADLKCEAL